MLATRKLVTVFSILAAGMIVAPVFALKVTEPAAASHGYPGLCDINGKKLAVVGEFRQWVENDRLDVVITYKFSAGEVYEEHSQFRQEHRAQNSALAPQSCNYADNKEMGTWLNNLLKKGGTQDWRKVLKEATGEDISTRAPTEYFKPLMSWLEEQNKGRQIGWE